MDRWEIIKSGFCVSGPPRGSMGKQIELQAAAKLFVALRSNLADVEIASAAFNADREVREALLAQGFVDHLRDLGVL